MSQVRALTRNEVVGIGWSGDAEVIDLKSGKSYMIRGSVSTGYNHSDYQTKTTTDTAIKKQVAGNTWNWTARPVILKLKGHLIAASTHTYPHSIPVASNADNIVSPPRTRANEKDAKGNWVLGSHFCLHYIDSIIMRTPDTWTKQMNAAIQEAVVLGNQMFGGTVDINKPLLMSGSSGDKVKELQNLLNQKGANPQLNADGSFGPLTKTAVENFQKANGITVTGTTDDATWNKLKEIKEEVKVTQSTGDNPSSWAKSSTDWAKSVGLFTGDGQGNYDWQGIVTREQAAQILYNLQKIIKK